MPSSAASATHIMGVYNRAPVQFERGEGVWLHATNGETYVRWPQLRQSVIAANSFYGSTERLPEEQVRSVLPDGQVASDTRKLLLS